MTEALPLILASRSPQRAALLEGLGVSFQVAAADVDETPLKNEAPLAYVQRVAACKAQAIAAKHPSRVVLAADTPVIARSRILQTPTTRAEAEAMLRAQSNRRVHIPTALALVDAGGKLRTALCDSWVKFMPLPEAELQAYLDAGLWQKVSGGMKIEHAALWITHMQGSPSGIQGLPLYHTAKLLRAAGVRLQPQPA